MEQTAVCVQPNTSSFPPKSERNKQQCVSNLTHPLSPQIWTEQTTGCIQPNTPSFPPNPTSSQQRPNPSYGRGRGGGRREESTNWKGGTTCTFNRNTNAWTYKTPGAQNKEIEKGNKALEKEDIHVHTSTSQHLNSGKHPLFFAQCSKRNLETE